MDIYAVFDLFYTIFSTCVGWFNSLINTLRVKEMLIACVFVYSFYRFVVRPMVSGNVGNIVSDLATHSTRKGNNEPSSYTKNKIHNSKTHKSKGD